MVSTPYFNCGSLYFSSILSLTISIIGDVNAFENCLRTYQRRLVVGKHDVERFVTLPASYSEYYIVRLSLVHAFEGQCLLSMATRPALSHCFHYLFNSHARGSFSGVRPRSSFLSPPLAHFCDWYIKALHLLMMLPACLISETMAFGFASGCRL